MKIRQHNEYFRTVSLNNRKSCPNCKKKLDGESIWSWGEYIYGKWRTVKYFCRNCFKTEVQNDLNSHTADCGCVVNLCGRGDVLPNWLNLGKNQNDH